MLQSLTTDELQKYAEIAKDQITEEQRWTVLYLVLLVISLGVLAWVGIQVMTTGFSGNHLYGLGLAGILAYWPYRSMKIKSLWRGHCNAVRAELKKRTSDQSPAPASNTVSTTDVPPHGDEHKK